VDPARYAELFLTESREHLSAINQALLELERAARAGAKGGRTGARAAGGDTDVQAAVGSLFRAVHTVKGMSATMGYSAVAALSHEMEALLDGVRSAGRDVDAPLMDLLFEAADALESSIERAVSDEESDPRAADVTQRLRDLLTPAHPPAAPAPESSGDRPTRRRKTATGRTRRSRAHPEPDAPHGGRAEANRPEMSRPPAAPGTAIRILFDPDAPLRGARAAMAVARAHELGEVTAVQPAPERFADPEFGHELWLRVVTTAPTPEIERRLGGVGDVTRVDVERDETTPAARESSAPREPSATRGSNGQPAAPGGSASLQVDHGPKARHVRIDLRRLDALMNLIGELVIARGRLVELTAGSDDAALVETMDLASRLIGDLQDEIMTCRMVPVWQVFDRFPRLVRDAARALGKQVELEVEGKEIELDRSMLDEIGDPIVHLLRNALDHGIESPEERAASGKPPEGRLTLSAMRDRSAVLIRVADDGRGIDRGKVLARALDAGLVDAGTTALTDEEVIHLIARPGFTTAERVTSLSGRGVGIDAVQARVRALGGAVDIRSVPGQGTTVTARLPLTLAIMRALLARVAGETYAFPMAHIDETVAVTGASFAAVRGQPVLLLRGEAVPYVQLRSLIGLGSAAAPDGSGGNGAAYGTGPGSGAGGPAADPEQHILVVESAGRRAAIAVDELTGQQDIVVKQFDAARGGAALFSGATILGDGAPALIVDVSTLC